MSLLGQGVGVGNLIQTTISWFSAVCTQIRPLVLSTHSHMPHCSPLNHKGWKANPNILRLCDNWCSMYDLSRTKKPYIQEGKVELSHRPSSSCRWTQQAGSRWLALLFTCSRPHCCISSSNSFLAPELQLWQSDWSTQSHSTCNAQCSHFYLTKAHTIHIACQKLLGAILKMNVCEFLVFPGLARILKAALVFFRDERTWLEWLWDPWLVQVLLYECCTVTSGTSSVCKNKDQPVLQKMLKWSCICQILIGLLYISEQSLIERKRKHAILPNFTPSLILQMGEDRFVFTSLVYFG